MKNTTVKIAFFMFLFGFAFSGHLFNAEEQTSLLKMAPLKRGICNV